MKNWKTTTFGVGGSIAYLVYKILSHHPISMEEIITVSTLVGTALSAKDYNVTGGTVPQNKKWWQFWK